MEIQGSIDTIIGLPEKLFYSTGIPVCVLVLKKCRTANDILFINAAEHYEKGKRQNHLSNSHIGKIITTYRDRPPSVERFARSVMMDEIIANDYNLNIARYVSLTEPEAEIDLADTHKQLMETERQIHESTKKHDTFLQELGLPQLSPSN